MVDHDKVGVPAKIDRDALDRIIRRATELQTSERDIGEGLTEDEVLSLGTDVGIPARYLRQAMLEDRTTGSTAESSTVLGRLVGAKTISAQRVIAGARDDIEATLMHWMERNELLVVQRQLPGRIAWEPVRGVQAALRRGAAALEGGRARFMLTKADVVTATITALEPGYWHVQLDAVLGKARGEVIGGAATLLGLAGTGTVILLALSAVPLVALLPLPAATALSWLTVRSYRPTQARTLLGMERILDHLQQGGSRPETKALPEPRSGVLDQLAGEVRRVLGSASRRRGR